MSIRRLIAASSLILGLSSVALANGKPAQNCEVKGKKSHVKDEAACTKKKGKWMGGEAVKPTAAAPAAAAEKTKPVDTAEPAKTEEGGETK